MDMVTAIEEWDAAIRQRAGYFHLDDPGVDGEDLVQEAYLGVWARIARGGEGPVFAGGEQDRNYFFVAVANAAKTAHRRYVRGKRGGGEVVGLDPSDRVRGALAHSEDVPNRAIGNIMLADYLDLAARDHHLVPALLAALGWGYEEQASVTGVSIKTLRTQAFRTRERLYSRYFAGSRPALRRSRDLVAEAMAL